MTNNSEPLIVRAYDGEIFSNVPKVDAVTADAMLERAYKLHQSRAEIPMWRCIGILRNLIPLMHYEAEKLALLIANEGGKPLADARVEVDRAINGVDLAIAELGTHAGVEIPMGLTKAGAGRMAFTTEEPIGVVMAVSAFNHPLT